MMSFLIILSLFLPLTPAGNADTTFTIFGNVEGMDDTIVELIVTIQSEEKVLATTSLRDGSFTLTGDVEHPVYSAIRFVDQNKYIYLWLEPSEIHISANAIPGPDSPRELPATITGSAEQTLTQESLEAYDEIYRNVSELVEMKRQTDDTDERNRLDAEIIEARLEARTRNSAYILDFARKHNDRVVSAYIMRSQINDVYNDVAELDEILNSFSDRVKETPYFKEIREGLDRLIKTQPGSAAPEFTLKNRQGEAVSLSDFRGKIVLLDFWASWCASCIASIPSLKELYEKYRDTGFEIIGISTDSDEAAWLRSIEQHELPWINLIDRSTDGDMKNTISTDYSVVFLPTFIMVDKKGKILAKNLSIEEMERLLNDSF
jgi:peroxiredoxin